MAPVKPSSPVGAGGRARQDAGTTNGWTRNEADHEALAMRLPRMTTRRWMVVVVIAALILVAITQLVAPILWDSEGRARDDEWLKAKSGRSDDGSY
jgi:hypothetical protein